MLRPLPEKANLIQSLRDPTFCQFRPCPAIKTRFATIILPQILHISNILK